VSVFGRKDFEIHEDGPSAPTPFGVKVFIVVALVVGAVVMVVGIIKAIR
jgi:hypothetical protein